LEWLSIPVPTQHQKESKGSDHSRAVPLISGTM
jgi:hypothetical protein